jgi:hypothetical protein
MGGAFGAPLSINCPLHFLPIGGIFDAIHFALIKPQLYWKTPKKTNKKPFQLDSTIPPFALEREQTPLRPKLAE